MSQKCLFAITEDVKKYLDENLGENEKTKAYAIDTIKKWLEENPKLNGCTEDSAILPFLRNCKYDLDKTKKKIKNYYTMRSKIPQWFSNRDPTLKTMQELLDLGVFVPLKKFVDNKLVYIVRMSAYNPKDYTFDEIMKIGKMVLDVVSHQYENVTIFGVITIFDMTDVTFAHVSCLSFGVLKNLAQIFLNDYWSPKLMAYLNPPFYIYTIVNIFKTFLSAKLRKRIQMCHEMESLHKIIDNQVLPPEYGGGGDNIDDLVTFWKENVLSHKEWLREDEKYKADL